MFSLTRSCEPAAKKTPKIAKILHYTRGTLVRWLHNRRKHGFHQPFAVLQADFSASTRNYFEDVSEKHAEKNLTFVSGRVLTRKYYLKRLSAKKESVFQIFWIKRTRLISTGSQRYLTILSKSAGQPRRNYEQGAKNRATSVFWACLACLCSSSLWTSHKFRQD